MQIRYSSSNFSAPTCQNPGESCTCPGPLTARSCIFKLKISQTALNQAKLLQRPRITSNVFSNVFVFMSASLKDSQVLRIFIRKFQPFLAAISTQTCLQPYHCCESKAPNLQIQPKTRTLSFLSPTFRLRILLRISSYRISTRFWNVNLFSSTKSLMGHTPLRTRLSPATGKESLPKGKLIPTPRPLFRTQSLNLLLNPLCDLCASASSAFNEHPNLLLTSLRASVPPWQRRNLRTLPALTAISTLRPHRLTLELFKGHQPCRC
jgi:hypothetical protein